MRTARSLESKDTEALPDLHLTGAPTTKKPSSFQNTSFGEGQKENSSRMARRNKVEEKGERPPFNLLDLNSHAFTLFLLQMSH